MAKGKKTLRRQEKQAVKEAQKAIREANKMLIPVPKATRKSSGFISFDPAGTFRFERNRWIRIYRVNNEDGIQERIMEQMDKLQVGVRMSKELQTPDAAFFLTLCAEGESYDQVSELFEESERLIFSSGDYKLLSVDEVMRKVRQEPDFSYASVIRGKKEWFDNLLSENFMEASDHFQTEQKYGMVCMCMEYPHEIRQNPFAFLHAIGCPVSVSMEVQPISLEDEMDLKRTMEQRYSRRLADSSGDVRYVNVSLSIAFTCDSEDARAIIEKTIMTVLSRQGYLIMPVLGRQKKFYRSIRSLGLYEGAVMRNLSLELMKQMRL